MNLFTDLDPYVIRARNQQIRKEVRSLRLEGQLRKSRGLRRPRISAPVERVRDLIGGSRWRAITSILLAFVAALAALAFLAPPSQAGGKPDLVVTSAHMTTRNYLFSGEEVRIAFTDTTKNVAKSNSRSAVAGGSKSKIFFLQTLASRGGVGGPSRDVPRLKPGESDKGFGSRKGKLSRAQIGGGYHVGVCADVQNSVAESNEDNNCYYNGQRLSIIPRQWTGTIRGSSNVTPGVTETWSAQVTYAFESFSGGYFNYVGRSGNVTYNISGTDSNGCGYSGSGTYKVTNSNAKLRVGYFFDTYEGFANLGDLEFHTITVHCPYGDITTPGPLTRLWFDTDDNAQTLTRHFGVTSLNGSYDVFLPTGENEIHYDWDLKAA